MPARKPAMELEPEKTREWNSKRLVFQRKSSGLSQKQLAEAIGVPPDQVMCMEFCTCIPSKEMLETLVSFFDVPEDYFGLEALGGRVSINPSPLSPQDERQRVARARLARQRQTLRKMMKAAGYSLDCTGLRYLSRAIDETISDTCEYVNGTFAMPPGAVQKLRAWFSSVPKTTE